MGLTRQPNVIPWWIEDDLSPPREILNRGVIARAAREIAESEGLDAVSTRRVAEHLGVRAGSLYRHFRNKDELMAAVVDGLLSEVEIPGPDAAWPDVLRTVAQSYRRLLRRHPSLLSPPLSERQPGPNALRVLEAIWSPLVNAGFSPVQAVGTSTSITNLAAGLVQLEVRERDASRANLWAELAQLPRGRFDTVVAVSSSIRRGDGDAIFDFALESFIEGLQVQVGEPRHRRTRPKPRRNGSRG